MAFSPPRPWNFALIASIHIIRKRAALPENMMRSFLLAAAFVVASAEIGLGMDACTRCVKDYQYGCTLNHGDCIKGCPFSTDKSGCQRRCIATFGDCDKRATTKCDACKP
jgi:hypothetical protein